MGSSKNQSKQHSRVGSLNEPFFFLSTSLKILRSLEPCSCEPGISGVSDASAYEFKRAFIAIGIDENEFFQARYEDEFSELEQEFIGKR